MSSSAAAKSVSAGLKIAAVLLFAAGLQAQKKTASSAPAPKAAAKPAAPASHPAAHTAPGARPGATPAARPGGAANAGRGGYGANAHPTGAGPARPGGGPVRTANGGTMTRTANGGTVTRESSGRTVVRSPAGHEAVYGRDGHPREVRANGVRVMHGPGGSRRSIVDRPNHTRMVVDRRGYGHIQRPYMYGRHAYYQRAYYDHGHSYYRVYRPYYYHGVYMQGYVPVRYYSPAFYGWAYSPWGVAVAYNWGWAGNPWYGYYGGYFTPYPVYASPSLWLTDYVIATSLQQAYQDQVDAGGGSAPTDGTDAGAMNGSGGPPPPPMAGPSAPLTPEVKQEIAAEVQQDLAMEKNEGQNPQADSAPVGLEQLLADGKPHVFVVGALMNVSSAGQDCSLTEGDVLQLNTPPPAGVDATDLSVLASKGSDCRQGSLVSVKLEDVQEMQNHMMAAIDQGLGDMQAKAGQGGLPALPAGAQQQPVEAPYAAAAPPPDPNGATELAQAAQQANQTEQQVLAEAAPTPAGGEQAVAPMNAPVEAVQPAATTITIALGQTIAQVTAAKGNPRQIVNLGPKQIYVYPDMKIIFVGGKVSDVQ